jgi:hypothetical protein
MPSQLAKVRFEQLWNNHPTIVGDPAPCGKAGKPNYHDQCAIRMGVCLTKSGFDLTRIKAPSRLTFCAYHDKKEGHTLRAEQLARGLIHFADLHQAGVAAKEDIEPKGFRDAIKGRTGLIFFADYWERAGETFKTRSGDHIDLWDGDRLTSWTSYLRILFNISGHLGPLDWSSFEDSRLIWFWEVKS